MRLPEPRQLAARGAKILRRFGHDFALRAVRMNKSQAMRVERETIDQGSFGLARFLAVIPLQLA
jgi:hypothetical protein